MTRPRSVDDWSAVETARDFRAYLSVLAYDLAWSARPWRNRRIPDFLDGWARWLRATCQGPDGARAEVDPPTWRGFAFQLREARFGDGPPLDGEVEAVEDWAEVVTAHDFTGFLRWLGDDFRRDEAERARRASRGPWAGELDWTSGDLGALLDTWAVWSGSAFGPDGGPDGRRGGARAPVAAGPGGAPLDPLTWRSCAAQLYLASRYE